MEKYVIESDIKLFGFEVKTFPEGIGESFASLAQMIEQGFNRSYYGISNISPGGSVIYKAAAEEKFEGEAEKYGCERYILEKGEYAMKTLKEWRSKTDTIKDIFHEIMINTLVDPNSYCIEWYKDDNEMLCLIKTAGSKRRSAL